MPLPSEEEFLGYFDSLSNWGRWGADDRLGTLNFITSEVRVAAAALVRDGAVVSLAQDMDPDHPDPLGRGTVLQRFMQHHTPADIHGHYGMAPEDPAPRFAGIREYVGLLPHGSHTHLDGLAHISWGGKNYNGFDASETSSMRGAQKLSIHHAHAGIVTRGVLLDIPALSDREWLDPGEAVLPEDLDAAAERQGVTMRSGDALLLYTGNFRRIAAEGLHPKRHHPGYSAACLPWLHRNEVSMISSDNINDVNPSGFEAKDLAIPVHQVGLVAMGLWLVDNMVLDELAVACRERSRWEFLFTMLPWRMVGVTASPVNPVAIF